MRKIGIERDEGGAIEEHYNLSTVYKNIREGCKSEKGIYIH